jgi:hypothetical protein
VPLKFHALAGLARQPQGGFSTFRAVAKTPGGSKIFKRENQGQIQPMNGTTKPGENARQT